MFEEKRTRNILCCWCYFIPEVEPLDVNTTGHLQTDTITGIFVLDILYIYISDLSSFLILTHYALIYVCLITTCTLSIRYRILNRYIVMIVFISIFTVNLSYNDILFCLIKISFVC